SSLDPCRSAYSTCSMACSGSLNASWALNFFSVGFPLTILRTMPVTFRGFSRASFGLLRGVFVAFFLGRFTGFFAAFNIFLPFFAVAIELILDPQRDLFNCCCGLVFPTHAPMIPLTLHESEAYIRHIRILSESRGNVVEYVESSCPLLHGLNAFVASQILLQSILYY